MPVRQRIDEAFGVWARVVWSQRWWVIVATLAVSAGFASRLPHLAFETSAENFLLDSDPVKVAYDELREQFGRDQLAILAIEPPEIFDLEFLAKLRRLHEELETEIPYLDEVTSLVNIRATHGEEDELIVDDLMAEMPETAADLAALRERVMSTPLYRGNVISDDGRITSIVIRTEAYSSVGVEEDALAGFDDVTTEPPPARQFLSGDENAEVVDAIKAVVERYRAPDFPVHVAGSVLLPHELMLAMRQDMPRFFLASLAVIGVLLVLLFRRTAPVFLALGVVVAAVVSTLGIAQLLGYKLMLSAQILPSFLLAVGVGYSVHLVAIYLQHLDVRHDRRAALIHALRHSGLPILMTGITTFAGMVSFLVAEMAPIRQFGAIAAIGVVMTLAFSLTLLPALLAAVPLRPSRVDPDTPDVFERGLVACGMFSARNPWKVMLVVGVLFVVSAAAATGVRFSSNPVAYLPADHSFRRALEYIDARMGGSLTLEVVMDTHTENGLQDPAVLRKMDALRDRVGVYRDEGVLVRRTISLLDVVEETHQALNGNRPEFYAIPDDRRLVAQELLLFENSGSDDLEKLVDSQFRLARFTVRTLWEDGLDKAAFVDRANVEFREIVGSDLDLTVTGMVAVITRTVRATTDSLTKSYSLALVLITPLMMLLIGSLRSGLVSMVPNLVPIVMTLGMMAWVGMDLDMFTMLFGCIAIGVAVDDTIHFIAGFRRYFAESGDALLSVERTLHTTGRALLFTSIVLTMGFMVFLLSSMGNLRAFGQIAGFAIGIAFLLDITATPALLVLVSRRR